MIDLQKCKQQPDGRTKHQLHSRSYLSISLIDFTLYYWRKNLVYRLRDFILIKKVKFHFQVDKDHFNLKNNVQYIKRRKCQIKFHR